MGWKGVPPFSKSEWRINVFVLLSYPISLRRATVTTTINIARTRSFTTYVHHVCSCSHVGREAREVLSCTNVVGFARAACHLLDTQSALALFFSFFFLRNPRRFPISAQQLRAFPHSAFLPVLGTFSEYCRAENRIRDFQDFDLHPLHANLAVDVSTRTSVFRFCEVLCFWIYLSGLSIRRKNPFSNTNL